MHSGSVHVWLGLVIYFGITFLMAWLSRRRATKEQFMEEFFVAGRGIGAWILGLTWIATAASGGTFIGAPALAHTYGWILLLWIASYMVFATTGIGLLGKRVASIGRQTGALTFPDLLRDRFESRAIGITSALAILILYTAFMVAQYIAGARLLEVVLGVPYVWGVLGFVATVSLYTSYGGFRAVAWTDAFQALVMLAGVLIAAPFAIRKAGGFPAIFDNLMAQSPGLLSGPGPNHFLPVPAAISFFCVFALAAPGQPSLVTRFLACRDTRALKRASFLIGLYILLLYPAIMTLGVVGRVLRPDLRAADHATPATILSAVPPVLAGLVLAAPLAAIMSTVSSFLLVTSSAFVRDLYQRNAKSKLTDRKARLLTHAATFIVAAIGVGFALNPPQFLQYIVIFSGTGLSATFLFPLLLGLYWPRMNKAGCLAAILGGFLSFVAQYAFFGTKSFAGSDPFVWSLAISLVCGVVAALVTAPGPSEITRRYFAR